MPFFSSRRQRLKLVPCSFEGQKSSMLYFEEVRGSILHLKHWELGSVSWWRQAGCLLRTRNPIPSLPPRILDATLRGPLLKPKAPSFRLREVWGSKGPTAHHSSLRPGDDGCKQLSDGLKPLASLQHLYLILWENKIGPGPRQSEVQGFDSSVGARKLGVEWPWPGSFR